MFGYYGWGWPLSLTSASSDKDKEIYNEAIKDAISVIEEFDSYSPYIVEKIKFSERKKSLIKTIKGLEK